MNGRYVKELNSVKLIISIRNFAVVNAYTWIHSRPVAINRIQTTWVWYIRRRIIKTEHMIGKATLY